MAPRLAVVGRPVQQLLLVAVVVLPVVAVVDAQLGERGGGTLRGSVACLDCARGHDLSGVVVAVRCGGGGGAGRLRAAQTDERGGFDVAVPVADDGDGRRHHSRCAARVLGGAEQLCAPGRLAVAPVVAAGREPGSYALGSRLGVFTRCGALATTTAAGNDQSPTPPRARRTPRQTPATSPPHTGRSTTPPYDGPGLQLIYFFPFLPIIGIP